MSEQKKPRDTKGIENAIYWILLGVLLALLGQWFFNSWVYKYLGWVEKPISWQESFSVVFFWGMLSYMVALFALVCKAAFSKQITQGNFFDFLKQAAAYQASQQKPPQ